MKHKFYFLTLFFCSVLLFSCEKDPQAVTKNENYLSFKDRTSFESAINSKDLKGLRTANFKSLKEAPNNLGIESEFLQSVLSPEGEIQIGQWLFKLNGEDKTVKVLNPTTKAITGNFTFEDDVLDLLENGITSSPTPNQRVQLFCGEGGVSVNGSPSVTSDSFTYNDVSYIGGCKTKYAKAGIYFEFRISYGLTTGFSSQPLIPYIKDREYWIEPKCRGVETNHAIGKGTYQLDNDFGGNPFWGNDEKIYASTTALHRLKVVQTYTWYNDQGAFLADVTQTINRGF